MSRSRSMPSPEPRPTRPVLSDPAPPAEQRPSAGHPRAEEKSAGGRADPADRREDAEPAPGPQDHWDEDDPAWERPRRRSTLPRRPRVRIQGPRLVAQGKSGHVGVDADLGPESATEGEETPWRPENPYSSYDVATRGPEPVPDWLVTSLSAVDTRLGMLKSGKEADVSLLDRSLPGGPGCLLAVKQYRSGQHRMFHRDAGYLEGRRVRRSREGRAMAARTGFGRELLSSQWAAAEFAALGRLWHAGARVPYPVQLIGAELMMEFIGDPDGVAAPRLITADGNTDDFDMLWDSLVANLELLAHEGLTHGDLSPYNVLVHDEECVLIDLPQVIDVVANPQGVGFLDRDCGVISDFFARRGVRRADGELLSLHLAGIARRS